MPIIRPRLGLKLASVFLLLMPAICAQNRATGLIRGTAMDENGLPVQEAIIKVDPVAARMSTQHTLVRSVLTDAEGHFSIDHLKWGRYAIYSMKEDSDYPDTSFSFYSTVSSPEATLTPTSPIADVLVRLGPKAGVLVGSVSSAETGAPLNAVFKLVRKSPTNDWFSTSAPSSYRVLLPSSVPVLVEVSAPGYKTWTPLNPLSLEPGAETHIDVLLKRSPDQNLEPSQFLIPNGYVGWLLLVYQSIGSPPVPAINGVKVFKFQQSNILKTSSRGPERGAETTYLYYSDDGSVRNVPMDYRNRRGMIWGEYEGDIDGVTCEFGFFVGSEEEYTRAKSGRPAR